MTDRETNTLATHGLEEPFFQLCCCVSFLFWQEIGLVLHTPYVLRVPYSWGAARVQLVGELLLELLVRGSNPLGVGLLLESVVRGWNLTCPIRVHLSVDTGTHTAKEVCILIM